MGERKLVSMKDKTDDEICRACETLTDPMVRELIKRFYRKKARVRALEDEIRWERKYRAVTGGN